MAFIRNYSEQGDPRRLGIGRSLLRAGRLQPHPREHFRFRTDSRSRHGMSEVLRERLLHGAAGDPFGLRLPKFVRKVSLKSVARTVGRVAKAALPLAAPFIPGVGPFLAPLVGGSFAGGGGPDSAAPELVQQPEYQGAVGELMRTFESPLTSSRAAPRRSDGTYPGDFDEDDYTASDDDDDDDEEDY